MVRATRSATVWQTVVGALGLVVVVWVGSDLRDIVTSGGERPTSSRTDGQDPGVSDSGVGGPGGSDPGGSDHSPPEGQHDPSQFDHG